MRILFLGSINGNNGPVNVNKGLVSNFTEAFLTVKSEKKILYLIELLWKIIRCNVIVVSGLGKKHYVAVALGKMLQKKTVYIMHGCFAYECILNNFDNAESGIAQENFMLNNVDLILPVSKKYSQWVQNRYPQYAGKINYIYNGLDTNLQAKRETVKEKGKLIVAGGDRAMKNNAILAEIAEELSGKVNLEICGYRYRKQSHDFRYSYYTGLIPRRTFIEHLEKSELFILNSTLESFGLSAIEALLCGCSVLISESVGATDLLELEETDIIHNPADKEEIKSKILYLLEHPNNERLRLTFHPEDWTYRKTVERLQMLCEEL